MSEFFVPGAYAVLVWWFTTGIILFLDGLPPATFRWSMLGASLILPAAGWAVHASAVDTSISGAYTGFTAAILVWGWLEMSFLMGYVTGPRKHACPDSCAGGRHFVHATQAIIYNELATAAGAGAIAAATWSMPNRVALWTYLILWVMRLSAKLNLFFGVPNLGEKFLPVHLRYLKSFFKKRAMNFLFPLSVGLSTLVTIGLARKLLAASAPFDIVAYALLTSLLALAVIEHWFMVIPLPTEKLWNWAMRPGGRGTVKSR